MGPQGLSQGSTLRTPEAAGSRDDLGTCSRTLRRNMVTIITSFHTCACRLSTTEPTSPTAGPSQNTELTQLLCSHGRWRAFCSHPAPQRLHGCVHRAWFGPQVTA